MSSNKRARTRAIRAEMATSGESYSRAAHAATTRAARHLRAVCFTCRKDIADGNGVIHIRHAEVARVEKEQAEATERRVEKATAEGRTGFAADVLTLSEFLDWPQDARWQVHCFACNPHRDDDCEGCYAIRVERCRTWAQLVEWTVHLSEKEWVGAATNWMEFIRAVALGSSPVGLLCDPADRIAGV
jgi:hypothetical protein